MAVYFNPRARKERDNLSGGQMMIYTPISIHAPVKSATRLDISRNVLDEISIHAPVKSATPRAITATDLDAHFNPRARKERDLLVYVNHNPRFYFNPRARKERDPGYSPFQCKSGGISIHAPVKSATVPDTTTFINELHFNPRARKERDEKMFIDFLSSFVFQSTRP